MIGAIDHIALAVRDFSAAVDGYRRLLGREPELEPRDGADRAWFHFPNAALEVIAATGDGPAGERVRRRLEETGEGLWILAFKVDDLDAASHLVSRRGLATEPVGAVTRTAAGGLQLVLTPGRGASPSPTIGPVEAAISALDHVVVHTPDIERAVANFAGRLGLDLRLDRANPRWGARQLFFRCGDAMIEFAAKLDGPVSDDPDRFGGLAWRVDDPEAAQARLAAEGFDVSEVRTGRKPGTKVFTVRDAPGGVPILMIHQDAERVAA